MKQSVEVVQVISPTIRNEQEKLANAEAVSVEVISETILNVP